MADIIFISGIGTGIGKTVASAIVTEALQADYWKPVQAGFEDGTDSEWVRSHVSSHITIHPETYKLKMPASPHIAAREEGITIDLNKLQASIPRTNKLIVAEGAGGLLVPLNQHETVADLILKLNARLIIVSRNYLGSINHSLLTSHACHYFDIRTLGWIFNDQYLNYEEEIVEWTGLPRIGSIPFSQMPDRKFIQEQAALLRPQLLKLL